MRAIAPAPLGSATASTVAVSAPGSHHAVDEGAPRSWERALGALFAGLLALPAAAPISDNSLLTHIATGRLQARSGLPQTNPFLTTSSDFPVPSWWWSGLLGWTERLGGLAAVRLLTAVFAAVLGWLAVRVSRPHNAPGTPAANALVQAFPAGVLFVLLIPWMNARPQLGGFVLLAAALIVWRERRSALWMVPVFAIWVNVHGTWLYAALVLAILWIAEAFDDREWHLERLPMAAAGVGGLLAGGLFYPQVMRLVMLPTEQLGSAEARQAIGRYAEWQRASIDDPSLWIFALVVLVALYGALGVRKQGRIRWGSVAAVLMLSLLGISALRLIPVAAIALTGFAAMGVAQVSTMEVPSLKVRRCLAGIGGTLLFVSALTAARGPHADLERFPVEEVDWLQERSLVANPDVRIIHNDVVGNYLEFRYGAGAYAWVDDRPSVDTLIDYVTLRNTEPGWQDAMRRADPDVVLWNSEDALPDELLKDPLWNEVLTTEQYRVLCHARIADRCD